MTTETRPYHSSLVSKRPISNVWRRLWMQLSPPKHWMKNGHTVFVSEHLQKLTTLCMSLWSFRQKKKKKNWLYNLYEDITSVTFLLLDQTCFKRELWIFLLPQTDCNCSKRYKWTIEETLTSVVVCFDWRAGWLVAVWRRPCCVVLNKLKAETSY